MELIDSEKDAIRNKKIKAIMRFDKVRDKSFEVDGKVYKIVKKKRWSMRRCAARRCTDWGKDVQEAVKTIDSLYEYMPEVVVYLLVFKLDNRQKSLND